MLAEVDVNMTLEVVENTEPGHSFQPWRWAKDARRVAVQVYYMLKTWRGTWAYNPAYGNPVNLLLDESIDDAEVERQLVELVTKHDEVDSATASVSRSEDRGTRTAEIYLYTPFDTTPQVIALAA